MQTKLIWITPNAEKLISYIARVSNPENQDNPDYVGLIRYMLNNKHWSPFDQVSVSFEVVTSRAISAQIIRHKSMFFQEFSQRYSKVVEFEPIEIRRQASKNRQSSEDVFDPILDCGDHQIPASELIDDVLRYIQWTYEKLLELDVAKECARMILPLTAQTTIYMTGTLRSWIHYIGLRNDSHAQKEHRLIAIAIEEELRKHFPVVFAALDQIKEKERKEKELIKLLVDNDKADIDLLKMLLGVVHE